MKYIDKQKYACCQLIAAFNALIFFREEAPDLDSEAFEILADIAKCKHGGALNIEEIHKILGLIHENGWWSLEWITNNLPVEMSVWHDKVGYHSILIVAVKGDKLRIANFTKKKWWKYGDLIKCCFVNGNTRCRAFKML